MGTWMRKQALGGILQPCLTPTLITVVLAGECLVLPCCYSILTLQKRCASSAKQQLMAQCSTAAVQLCVPETARDPALLLRSWFLAAPAYEAWLYQVATAYSGYKLY
jgi:hypothetical protein